MSMSSPKGASVEQHEIENLRSALQAIKKTSHIFVRWASTLICLSIATLLIGLGLATGGKQTWAAVCFCGMALLMVAGCAILCAAQMLLTAQLEILEAKIEKLDTNFVIATPRS